MYVGPTEKGFSQAFSTYLTFSRDICFLQASAVSEESREFFTWVEIFHILSKLFLTIFLFLPRSNSSWFVWLAMNFVMLSVHGISRKSITKLGIFSGCRLRSSYLRTVIEPGNLTDKLFAAFRSSVSLAQATSGFQQRGLNLQSFAKGSCIRELNTPRGSRTSRITSICVKTRK